MITIIGDNVAKKGEAQAKFPSGRIGLGNGILSVTAADANGNGG